MEGTKEEHESYGLVGAHRVTGGARNLFGSSIRHHNTVLLTIKRAEKHRDLSHDWYFGRKQLIEIELSPVQFAEMITSMNVGDGVPCTIRAIGYDHMADPPEVSQRQVFQDEFEKDMEEVGKTCYGDIKDAKEILTKKGAITMKERQQVLGILQRVVSNVTDHLPFVHKQFNEAMDKTTLEAKGEVEAFIQNKVQSLGIEALKEQLPQLTEGENK